MIHGKEAAWDRENLKNELMSINVEEKRSAMKRVIAFFTLGQDMSELFVHVVNCMQTPDVELKKLVYLYVMSYAEKNAELVVLSVSSFTKDTNNPNPLLRALALRTMGCIRIADIAEHLCDPLKKAIEDEDPYVRKTAAVCVAKLFDMAPDVAEEQGFIELLREMLTDSNPTVVSNTIAALCEIQENSKKEIMRIDVKMLQRLLTAMDECIEWGQINILDALIRYKPRNSREAESIIDRLTPRLQHTNSAIVLSSTKIIIKYLDSVTNEDSIRSVLRKLAPPLVTLLSSENSEIQYIALRNINLIVQKKPNLLINEVKVFFCKYNDPIYVKMEKLDILVKLARQKTIDSLLTEFKTYATEVDVDVVRRAVRCIGECAIKIDKVADKCIKSLVELIKAKVHVVVQEAVIVIRDIFRRYPNKYESIIAELCANLDTLDEPEAKSSMIWIIGEYGDRIENADELIENFISNWDEENSSVQLQILTASVKLFLYRPDDCQSIVTQVIDLVTKYADNPDLRDRGYVYWRLLSQNPAVAKSVVFADRPIIGEGLGNYDPSLLTILLDNIGTLSGLYHSPPEAFVKKDKIHTDRQGQAAIESDDEKESKSGSSDEESESESESESEDEKKPVKKGKEDLDLFGFGGSSTMVTNMPEILSAQDGHGLSIRGAFIRESGKPFISMSMNNNSTVQMSQFAIKFNKSLLALKPDTEQHTVVIPPGGQGTLKVSCSCIASQLNSSGDCNIEIALNTMAGMFRMNVKASYNVVLNDDGGMEPSKFGGTWTSQPDSSGNKVVISCQNPSKDNITSMMKSINCHFVTQRNVGGIEAYYYYAKSATNQVFLVEFKVNGNKIQSIVKCGNPAYAGFLNDAITNTIK